MTDKAEVSNDRILLNQKNEENEKRKIYTDVEASKYLRISQVSLWRLRKAGKITFRRVTSKIIYLQEDLDDFLNQNVREAFGLDK